MPFPSSGAIKLSDVKDSVYKQDVSYFMDKLSTKCKENATAAYSVRLVNSNYSGPCVNVRRSSDNATQDFYADINGNLGTQYLAKGTSFDSWLGTSVGYVTKMYDQTGNGRHISQSTNANQPTIGPYPVLDAISSAGKSAVRGAYSLCLVNGSYTGPTIRLRRGSDNALQDFYADCSGRLGTSLNAGGTRYKTWIGDSVAYVHTWYDQSGNGFHATQTTNGSQPVYDGITGTLNFYTQVNSFLNMGTASSGPIPTATVNLPYTFIAKHGRIFSQNSDWNVIVAGGGSFVNNQANALGIYTTNNNDAGYLNYWWNNDAMFGSFASGNHVVTKFDGSTHTSYIQNAQIYSASRSGLIPPVAQQYIGRQGRENTYLNGELENLFIMNTAVSDADRFIFHQYQEQNGHKNTTRYPFRYNISYNGNNSLTMSQTSNSMEYPPPGTITANTTTVSGQPYGNGTYICSRSNHNNNDVWNLFSPGSYDSNNFWETFGYSTSTGNHSGNYSTSTTNYGSISGDWAQIQLPTAIAVKSFSMGPRDSWATIRSPRRFALLGSNNGSTWKCIHYESGVTDWESGADKYFATNIDSTSTYSYLRLVVTEICNSYTGNANGAHLNLSRLKFNPSMPLTRGSKGFAYFVQCKAKRGGGFGVICEQNAPSGTTSNTYRASLCAGPLDWTSYVSNAGFYYFAGQGNDAYIQNFGYNTDKSLVLVCDHNLLESSYNINLYENATEYGSSTPSRTTNLVQTGGFFIGQRNGNDERFYGDINEVIVVNKLISEREALFYTQPNDLSSFNKMLPKNKPKYLIANFGEVVPNSIPIDYVLGCDMRHLSDNIYDETKINQWGRFTQWVTANKPVFRLPSTVGANGGPTNESPYMSFTAANSHHMTAGERTFNVTSGGGFTAIACIKLTATPAIDSRVFDFGNAASNNNILLGFNSSVLYYFFFNDGSIPAWNSVSLPPINQWVVVTLRYRTDTNLVELFYNSARVHSMTASTTITNRTISNAYLGRSHWTGDGYASFAMSGLYAYARYLSDTEMGAVSNLLMYPNVHNIPKHITNRYENLKVFGRAFTHPINPYTYNKVSNRLPYGHTFFDGLNGQSYIEIDEFSGLPFSVSFWATPVGTGYYTLISITERGRFAPIIQIDYDGQGGADRFVFALALPNYWTGAPLINSARNTPAHFVLTIDQNFQANVYHNGALHSTVNGTGLKISASRWIIGGSGDGGAGARGYYGFLSDVRIYDYVLRTDEISDVYGSPYTNFQNNSQITYQTPQQYLVNRYNWRSTMSFYQDGSYAGGPNGSNDASPPYDWYVLSAKDNSWTNNRYYHNAAIQNYKSFTLSFEMYIDISGSNDGDGFYVTIGNTSNSGFYSWGTSAGGYVINFQIWPTDPGYPVGVNLIDGRYSYPANGGILAHSGDVQALADVTFVPITITYNKGTSNTWVINVNGKDVITYNDPNNAAWLSTAGSNWAIGSYSGGATFWSVLRSVELSYTPDTTEPLYSSRLLGAGNGLSSIRNNATSGLIPGFTWKFYNGSTGDIDYGNDFQYRTAGRTTKTGNLQEFTTSYINSPSTIPNHSVYAEGWLFADTTGTWTFGTANTGGFSYIYINDVFLVRESGGSATISLTKGTYYKINLYYGKLGASATTSFTYTKPGGSSSSDWSNLIFSSTGTNSRFPAESAKIIKDITQTNTDGIYYININGTSTATYCLMNDFYDGGGWMMLMKGSRNQIISAYYGSANGTGSSYNTVTGTILAAWASYINGGPSTFSVVSGSLGGDPWPGNQKTLYVNLINTTITVLEGGTLNFATLAGPRFFYTANYWTTNNTLNETDVTRIDGDAKYNAFNYAPIKDVMAIFPDIPSKFTTNPLGRRGGSVKVHDGWSWKVDNWNTYTGVVNQLSGSLTGAYALYRANIYYGGPVVKLRRRGDNATQDFYADVAGNLGTKFNGSGTSLSSWIGGTPSCLLNSNTWTSLMTSINTYGTTLTDPFKQSQITDGSVHTGGGWSYGSLPISTVQNFVFECAFYHTGGGDALMVAFGGEGNSIYYSSGIKVHIEFWSGNWSGYGVYILKNNEPVAYYAVNPADLANNWFNLKVIYNRSTTNTWEVFYNKTSVLTYSDSSAISWANSATNNVVVNGYSGGGLRLTAFVRQVNLWTNFAYVDTWYDQSGGYHATQSTQNNQPIITCDSSGKYMIDSQLSSQQFLNMGTSSAGPIPTGSTSYTIVLRHGAYNGEIYGAFLGSGIASPGRANTIRSGYGEGVGYWNYWWSNDITIPANDRSAGNTIGFTWNGTTHASYVTANAGTGMQSTANSRTPSAPNTASGQQTLFKAPYGEFINAQLYHVFISNTALGTNDLSVLTNAQNYSQSPLATNRSRQLCTALSGFQISRTVDAYPDQFDFNGFSTSIASYQTGSYRFVFGGGRHADSNIGSQLRWGWLFNNETNNNFASQDTQFGIGTFSNYYSAGDNLIYAPAATQSGIARTMRFELFGR
jgi:hypothetical protein